MCGHLDVNRRWSRRACIYKALVVNPTIGRYSIRDNWVVDIVSDNLKDFFSDRHQDILRLAESLEKADRSRTEELRGQLDEAERELNEYRSNLSKLESRGLSSAEVDRLRSVCETAASKLEQLIEKVKQSFDSPSGT